MTKDTDPSLSHPFLWILTVTVVAFNIFAAMAQDARLTLPTLAMTGLAVLFAFGIAIRSGLMKKKTRAGALS